MKSTQEKNKYFHSIDLPNMHIPHNVWLAPLAGYSESALRSFIRKHKAGFLVTEMVSIEGVVRQDKGTMMYASIDHDPVDNVAIQLFGSDPKHFYEAASILKEKTNVRMISINMGCPVRKVTKNGAGSALLDHPDLASDIVKAIKDTGLICEAKIRKGFNKVTYPTMIEALQKAGVDVISMHGRLASDGYSGHADWDALQDARSKCDTVFIANGDIKTPELVEEVLEKTKADGVMIGRGAIENPFIFSQTVDYFTKGSYKNFEKESIIEVLMDFLKEFQNIYHRDEISKVRSILIHAIKNLPAAKEMRVQLGSAKTVEEAKQILLNW